MSSRQCINEVTLAGYIGSVRTQQIQDVTLCNLTVATQCVISNVNEAVLEVTWHNVAYCDKPGNAVAEKLQKGAFVHVRGRIRNVRHTDREGKEVIVNEIVAAELEVRNPTEEECQDE